MEHLWENATDLAKQAIQLGFTGEWLLAIPFAMELAFKHKGSIMFANYGETVHGRMAYQTFFELDENSNRYVFTEYRASLLKEIRIDHSMVEGIDTKALDEQMGEVNWAIDHKAIEEDTEAMTIGRSKMISLAERCLDKLGELSDSSSKGTEIANLLKAKYLLNTAYEELVPLQVKNNYYRSCTFSVNGGAGMSREEALNILCGRAVRKICTDNDGGMEPWWFKAPQPEDPATGNSKGTFFRDELVYGNFRLYAILEKLPFASEPTEALKKLLQGLPLGDLVSVPVWYKGHKETMQLWAMPEKRSIGVLDNKGNAIDLAALMGSRQQQNPENEKATKNKNKRKGM